VIEILRSTPIHAPREEPARQPHALDAKARDLLRRLPDEWALLFGIGFAIGIAAGSFFT
jgi:hypothetical protein